ncbi:hypothetical protein TNCV_656231 [Trichonephila clavipes]|nr:hypothetical protein TNCV_656231 [Trichonephila clavipes]
MQQFKTYLSSSRVKRICKQGEEASRVTFDTVDGVRTGLGETDTNETASKGGRGLSKNGESPEEHSKTLVTKLLPPMAAPNEEVYE